jgi:TetR/AcrR family transcriptional regulator
MGWERARSEQQKEQRISGIISATARLYEMHSFEEITFVLIAKEAKFTRSNLYKYFNSKEEIFLELIKHDIVFWRKDVVANLNPAKIRSVKEFASVWVSLQVRHERLIKLLAILHNSLEKNVSIEKLTEFKRGAKEELFVMAEVLCSLFPKLTIEKAANFLELQIAAAIGLFQMTDLSEMQQQILEDPEFAVLKLDFAISFQEAVEYLLNGKLSN